MMDLFSGQESELSFIPLAARMRPQDLTEYVGQSHLIGEGKPLRKMIESGRCHSFILWGSPGVGKTTFAQLLSHQLNIHFLTLSAVMSGVKDIRLAVEKAKQNTLLTGKQSILFIDEVHRFNKSQQDAFLPHIEDGTFLFIGATTENPAFELNSALLSRARVYRLQVPSVEEVKSVLVRALEDCERGLGSRSIQIEDKYIDTLSRAADGDIRRALNFLEIVADLAVNNRVDEKNIEDVLGASFRQFDNKGDVFYDQISAFHKSVRGSSPDGALYWMARMLDGGCDPLYIARRLLAIASEDIGNADPRAMQVALTAWDVFERVGPGEGNRAIAQATIYLACAPKSNAVYDAFKSAMREVSSQPSYDVPKHLRNAPTSLAKSMGHGEDYRYAHSEPYAYAAGEKYLPEEIMDQTFYQPNDRGLEKKISEKMAWLKSLDQQSSQIRYRDKTFDDNLE
ncbi:replication-associated recombination protein A [Marinomonas sp. 2405UD68-3]|uniref:replication-associated recombination protein A n=1 Tax=Marinomonas sp. 2405UD68-3 TaxID=3391835 RepID=UPI0039C98890